MGCMSGGMENDGKGKGGVSKRGSLAVGYRQGGGGGWNT